MVVEVARCTGFTNKGDLCRFKAKEGEEHCGHHKPVIHEERCIALTKNGKGDQCKRRHCSKDDWYCTQHLKMVVAGKDVKTIDINDDYYDTEAGEIQEEMEIAIDKQAEKIKTLAATKAIRCAGKTKDGKRCKRKTTVGKFCPVHV